MWRKRNIMIIVFVVLHFLTLSFAIKTNTVRGVGLDESRYILAGLSHWLRGEFALASDSPPLVPMIGALPLLWQDVRLPPAEPGYRDAVSAEDARDRELWDSGRFAAARVNFYWYRFFCMARMTGFLWWLLGAWVIGRWSGELHGIPAALLAIALWCVCPNVLALEQQVVPWLPLAVSWSAAIYLFRGYLKSHSWKKGLRMRALARNGPARRFYLACLVRDLAVAGPAPPPGANGCGAFRCPAQGPDTSSDQHHQRVCLGRELRLWFQRDRRHAGTLWLRQRRAQGYLSGSRRVG